MALIVADKISLAFGHHKLLSSVSFSIEKNDKLGLVGRNGAGKSSLLKIISSTLIPDDGKIHYQDGCKIIYVAQEPTLNPENTIFAEIMHGLEGMNALLEQYYSLINLLATDYSVDLLEQLNLLQVKLEHGNGWSIKNLIDKTISELSLDGSQLIKALSGGVRKKVALAKALISKPDLLLLDEPTNHLDIDTIIWLEQVINNFNGSVLLITHDRKFLDNTVNKILEIDRGKLSIYPGTFTQYQHIKQSELSDEAKSNSEFDKFLAQEEVWIRKGVEARRTRNEGRVRRLHELRNLRAQRRDKIGSVNLQIDVGQLSGKIVVEVENITVKFADKLVVDDFSCRVMRGDKIGLIGQNGIGKSTLLKAILGIIKPTHGTVKLGTKLEIAYFDQLRNQLDNNKTVQDVIADGQDFIFINGIKKHIATYLEDFLFEPARFRAPVNSLSGGERNRLLLAKLFAQPANVLVLDEPTNDLDIETLELLEELLANYTGTVFIVSHDREFLDSVVMQSWVFLGNGKILDYTGGYSDWLQYKTNYLTPNPILTKVKADSTVTMDNQVLTNNRNKLSYKEKTELEQLPKIILELEQEQNDLNQKLQDSNLYKENHKLIQEYNSRLNEIEILLLEKLERWEYLESKK